MDFEKLFIFELANNHGGDLQHGLSIIRRLKEISAPFDFKFGVKLQYRDLDTFIHPEYQGRRDIKYIKRFMETRLKESEFKALRDEIKQCGFVAICTPFDEPSVDLIEKHGFDMIKIGSCSLTDWPLLERVVKTSHPIIASTAGVSFDDIDKVVLFLEHREKKFALMHCVGEYPTPDDRLRLDRIGVLQKRYPGVEIGFSTHESPENCTSIRMAIAKGARLFEKHVGLKNGRHDLNAYSATPEQLHRWLESAEEAFRMCGVCGVSTEPSEKERSDLKGLQRGVFSKGGIAKGEKISMQNVFFAIPNEPGQMLANDLSKYTEFTAQTDIAKGLPVLLANLSGYNLRQRILEIMKQVREVLLASKVTLPNRLDFEFSHHYGIDRFEEWGATIINCINREYCKKLIILLPGQKHPLHYHVKKEETFNVLFGDVAINLNGEEKEYRPGDMVVVERGSKHSFSSRAGAIFEEISTTHVLEDSFYDDAQVKKNEDRKTYITFWQDWLKKPIY